MLVRLAAWLALAASTGAHVGAPHAPDVKSGPLLEVRVRGNELVDGRGRPLRLLGVSRSGSQYMCVLGQGIFDGPHDEASIAAMAAWHVNVVRVPVNEDCWLGINGVAWRFAGQAYRTAISSYVRALNDQGIYAVVEVHWSAPGSELARGQQNMLDSSHGYRLWRSIARAFRQDRAVMFDLYNEPHGLAARGPSDWRCWARGCGRYAGMNGLVAAVRSTGARNVLLLAGVGWASDDSRWLAYEPTDSLHQLAAAIHVYRYHAGCTVRACWQHTLLPLAERVPVVADEFGEMQCGESAALGWLQEWMSFAVAHRIGMLAWSWNAHAGACMPGPSLIAGYEGAPTPYGAAVRAFYTNLR
ncbi:MAG TPA: cellulase family glycosylhydrolase [Solirubrobacteraceae bacterium]|nr:cellulase family glycosylhydrolase [Solirubrobacteraceae bacterium]